MWPPNSVTDARKFLHHKVEVTTAGKHTKIGWIYTIDPATNSIVLYVRTRNEKPKMTLILGHAIKDLSIRENPCDQFNEILDDLCESKAEVRYSNNELEVRKTKLQTWLEKNRLPVKSVEDKLMIAQALEILPPYTKHSCQSRNQIMLSRVQAIIEAMPDALEYN